MFSSKKKLTVGLVALLALASIVLSACSAQSDAISRASEIAADRDYYIPVNDVEGRNYNWRLEISDDPSLILWCTYFPPTAGVKPITVPIIGKLTSGSKRPFPEFGGTYENPDAQSMYGTSGDYRFGFGPSGKFEYYDFYQNTMCTTMPLTYQAELTVLVSEKDPILTAAAEQAKALLEQGDYAGAQAVIDQAIRDLQGDGQ